MNDFTTKEILLEFREEVRREFAALTLSAKNAHDDHETRIRSTEAAISRVRGAMGLLVVLVPIIAAIVAAFVK